MVNYVLGYDVYSEGAVILNFESLSDFIKTKMMMGDIVKVKAGLDGKTRKSAFNKIQSKHMDFIANRIS